MIARQWTAKRFRPPAQCCRRLHWVIVRTRVRKPVRVAPWLHGIPDCDL